MTVPTPTRRPAIVVVDAVPKSLGQLTRLLKRRFGADYEVEASASSAMALHMLRAMSEAKTEVALILADQWIPDMSGVDLLRASADMYPDAKKAVLLGQGELNRAREDILRATALHEIETYVVRPMSEPDETFYREISRFVEEWSRAHRPQPIAVRLIGDEMDFELRQLHEALLRSGVPSAFLPADGEPGRQALVSAGLDGNKPVAIMYDGRVLVEPTPSEVASAIGANDDPGDQLFDVIIVGAGPAGLAAAVYSASEGLSVLVVESEALGGQASTSSLIRNYLGFPHGLPGTDLATRSYWQAWFFGTRFLFGRRVSDLRIDGDRRIVTLDDGTEIFGRSVVLACGVSYRRIGIDRLEKLVGRGCFYGAPVTEAPGVAGHDVVVVGGGNSSAQTALYLARFAQKVTLVARRPKLDEMSHYLVRDLAAIPSIEVRLNTEVVDAIGEGRLQALVLRDSVRNVDEVVPANAVFILIGAEPRTEWMPGSIERDERGYVLTGEDVKAATVDGERRPLRFETSMAGTFAAGDVRLGGMKRVAAAVGDGSSVMPHVHQYLEMVGQQAQSPDTK